MTIPTLHPAGLGEALGDTLITTYPLYIGARVWWVAAGGDDSNQGLERRQPFATLETAISEASDGDWIVVVDGYTETRTTPYAVNKRLTIIGSGQSDGKPTVKLTPNAASEPLFNVSVAGVSLRNLWIEENAQANDEPRINVTGTRFRMVGCYVECNGFDDDYALYLAAASGDYELRSCTFVSTATAQDSVPQPAVAVAQTPLRVLMRGVVFDGGTYGFANGIAYNELVPVPQLEIEQLSLLRGADMTIDADTIGGVLPTTQTGNPRISWNGGEGA